MGARMVENPNGVTVESRTSEENNPDTGIHIEAHEMIQELTNKITQLTLDIVIKDLIIRKLEAQTRSTNG